MNDVMVDLETMDNVMSASIVSIGAVQCDLTTGELGQEYYRVIDLNGQQQKGLTICSNTLYWWMQQKDGARHALTVEGKIFLVEMCNTFNTWLQSMGNPGNFRLWGNGASFDNSIIRYAYKMCDIDFPIPFWNDRDMRTILGFYPSNLQEKWRRANLRHGTHHNALADAKHQVKYCSYVLKELGVKELY